MKLKHSNPYLDKRDFRAVLFADETLTSINDVVGLFGGQVAESSGPGSSTTKISGCRAVYTSKNCFLRSADPNKRDELRIRKGVDKFRYDVYVFAYSKSGTPVFLVAIPFASMAREFFGQIHANKPSAKFAYFKPDIETLIPRLIERFKGSERIKTVGVNWSITGDTGRSDQVVLRGSDVIHSEMFRHLQSPTAGLALAARRLQVRFSMPEGHENLKLSFDKFGNYSIWVTSEGSNLPDVFEIFDILTKAKLMVREETFPVRNLDEEPILP